MIADLHENTDIAHRQTSLLKRPETPPSMGRKDHEGAAGAESENPASTGPAWALLKKPWGLTILNNHKAGLAGCFSGWFQKDQEGGHGEFWKQGVFFKGHDRTHEKAAKHNPFSKVSGIDLMRKHA